MKTLHLNLLSRLSFFLISLSNYLQASEHGWLEYKTEIGFRENCWPRIKLAASSNLKIGLRHYFLDGGPTLQNDYAHEIKLFSKIEL